MFAGYRYILGRGLAVVVYNGPEPPAAGATIPVDWTRVIREGQQVAVLHGESGWLQFSKRAKYDLTRIEDWWEAEVARITRHGCSVTVRKKHEQHAHDPQV